MSQDKDATPKIVINRDESQIKVSKAGMTVKSEAFISLDTLVDAVQRLGYTVTKKNSAVFTVEVKVKAPYMALTEDQQCQLDEMVKQLKEAVADCRFEHDLAAKIDVLIDGKSS